MKQFLLALFLLNAVPAHAVNVYLGTPFSSGGETWVPVMGNNIPDDLVTVGNVNLVTTGTVAIGEGWYYSTVWPENPGMLPCPQTQTYFDDIGLGYPEWYVSVSYSNFFCDLAAPSGMLGAFRVTGSGTIRMDNLHGHARDCTDTAVTLSVTENGVEIGGGTSGGGGGVSHEEGVMVGETRAPAKLKVKAPTTWARIKAMYR